MAFKQLPEMKLNKIYKGCFMWDYNFDVLVHASVYGIRHQTTVNSCLLFMLLNLRFNESWTQNFSGSFGIDTFILFVLWVYRTLRCTEVKFSVHRGLILSSHSLVLQTMKIQNKIKTADTNWQNDTYTVNKQCVLQDSS